MKMRRSLPLLAVLLIAAVASAQPSSSARLDQRVEELLDRMTLEEKLSQLVQFVPTHAEIEKRLPTGQVGSIFNLGGVEKINAMQRTAMEGSRLEIPVLFGHDVIHGYRTIFPIPLAMASSFDPESAELSARIGATEARADGVRWTFAPMVDIARDPRWGRIAEGAGEDPYLGSVMARAYVRGFQGDDLSDPDAVMACAKHFVGYGAAEAGRDYNSTDMSERTLREVYLPPFKAAVEAGVGTLMTGFNSLNGVPATANPHTLDEILRGEWEFEGFVVSDYTAVEELIEHGIAADLAEASRKAIVAGVDLNMMDGGHALLKDEIAAGRLDEEIVNESVRRILRAKFSVDLFVDPYADESRTASVTLTPEHRRAARQVAQKSIVLLKNDESVLPLSAEVRSLAVIGPLADAKRDTLGSWAAHGKPEETVSVIEGIRDAVSDQTRIAMVPGTGVLEGSDDAIESAVEAARDSDVVVMVLGETFDMSGEAASRTSLDLPGRQQELLEAVVATGKPVVLVLMSGRPLTIGWADENVPAIVQAWQPGTEGGHAVADVLFGRVNASAKLPITFPRSVGQIPIYYAHLNTGRPLTDHKYTTKYIDSPNTPLYPFGHGLSYTTFDYRDLELSAPSMTQDGRITVSAVIANTGRRAGDEIVQLYVGDRVASVAQPVRELRGFERVSLRPGEAKRVEFTVTAKDLEFWMDGKWVVEPGMFDVWVAPSSVGGLEGEFELK